MILLHSTLGLHLGEAPAWQAMPALDCKRCSSRAHLAVLDSPRPHNKDPHEAVCARRTNMDADNWLGLHPAKDLQHVQRDCSLSLT